MPAWNRPGPVDTSEALADDDAVTVTVRGRPLAAPAGPDPVLAAAEGAFRLMGDYLPHTEDEIEAMLGFLGLSSLDDLFAAVPAALRVSGGLSLDEGRPEPDVRAAMEALAGANRARNDRLVCFAGAGAYDHEVPPWWAPWPGAASSSPPTPPTSRRWPRGSSRRSSSSRRWWPGWPGCPSPTPPSTTGPAPWWRRSTWPSGRPGARPWVSSGIHPHWRAVLSTYAAGTGHRVVEVALDEGRTAWPEADGEPPGVLAVGYPNYLGCLEDLARPGGWPTPTGPSWWWPPTRSRPASCARRGSGGPTSWSGRGQPFGTPLSFGGPYLGLFACALSQVRRLPGRLVGETVDTEGRRAYVTTLRAREQDIRREKATSNVCTNQTLMAVTAAVQLGWLGTAGLAEVGLRCARGTRYLRESVLALDGLAPLTGAAAVVRETALRTPVPARLVVERMATEGYLAGVALADLVGEGGDGSLDPLSAEHGLLVAVTERRTRAEIDGYTAALDKAARPCRVRQRATR